MLDGMALKAEVTNEKAPLFRIIITYSLIVIHIRLLKKKLRIECLDFQNKNMEFFY